MELPLLSNPTQTSDIFSFRSCKHLRLKAHPAHVRYVLGARSAWLSHPIQQKLLSCPPRQASPTGTYCE